MTEEYDIAEIQRLVDDMRSVADTLVHAEPGGTPPSPGLVRLYADVEQLAAALREAEPPKPVPPRPRRVPAPSMSRRSRRRDAASRQGPAPGATDYWFG